MTRRSESSFTHRSTLTAAWLIALTGLSSAGCTAPTEAGRSDGSVPVDQGEAPDTPSKPTPLAIAWTTCSIPNGDEPIAAECATVDAPVRRGTAGGGTTPVAVYRLRSTKQPAVAQLWMLNGGPGAAGFTLAPLGRQILDVLDRVDVYLVDHRGTGASALLVCPQAEKSATSMGEYMRLCSREVRRLMGDRIDGFSTTEVAHDVRELIDATATTEQKVFVYGGSYGSYLAHRLLQIEAVRVDGIITDGNCIGTLCSFDTPQAFRVDEAVKHVLDVCRETPSCTARLGDDPWAFATETIHRLAAGHCAGSTLAARAPADWAAALGTYWPAGLAPTLYRLHRCSPDDATILDTLDSKLTSLREGRLVSRLPPFGPAPHPTAESAISGPLMYHVAASEMIPKPAPTASVLSERAETLTFKADPRALDVSHFDAWEGYPSDSYVGGWAKRDVPWLMMQGTFDFQTEYSLAERALARVENPSLQLVRVEGGGHGVVFASECSRGILQAFLANPRAKVDASCMTSVKRAALDLDASYTHYFFGVTDAWGDPLD